MPHFRTNKPSPSGAPKTSTAKALPEFASTWSQEQGRSSEQKAAGYYEKLGFQIQGRNQKIFGVEVDLILQREHWVLVEVKTLGHLENLSYRLSRKQKSRLLKVRHRFEDQMQQAVELRVLYVTEDSLLELSIEDHDWV